MLLYAVIARSTDGIVLVESTTAGIEGNHPQICSQLLQKLTANPSLLSVGNRSTYSNDVATNKKLDNGATRTNNNQWDGDIEMKGFWNGLGTEEDYGNGETIHHFFHVLRGESTYYVTLSDDTSARQHRVNFAFLDDLQKEFSRVYTPNKIENATAYGFDKSFSKMVSKFMHHYNTTRDNLGHDTKAAEINTNVQSIKKVLGTNIDILMRRATVLEALVDQTDDLVAESKVFQKRGKKLKRVMKRKNLVYKLIIAGFGVLIIYLMMVKLCGFDLSCQAESSNNDDDDNANGGYYRNDDGGN